MRKRLSQAQSKGPPRPPTTGKDGAHIEMQTTAIHITKDMWILLREVAFRRAQASGGRASVSELIRSLVEGQRAELKKEIEQK